MNPHLSPADPADLEEAVRYALRFGLTGKPHGKWTRDDDQAMARAMVAHLMQAQLKAGEQHLESSQQLRP